MGTLPLVLTFLVAAMLGFVGWLFLFRTGSVAGLYRRSPDVSGATPQTPRAILVKKRWFRPFLRFQGVLCWVVALLLLAVAGSRMMLR